MDEVELLQVGALLLALPTTGRAGPALPPQPPQQPVVVAGMWVVKMATVLNIPISNSAALVQLDWGKLLGPVKQHMQHLACMRLSAFGQAVAVSPCMYCLQMITWHIEHASPPPGDGMPNLEHKTAALVDQQQGPEE